MARAVAQFSLSIASQSLQWVGDPNLTFAGEQGDSLPFQLQVENTGPDPVTYTFNSAWPPTVGTDIAVVLDDATYERTVQPGATDTLDGHINIKLDAAPVTDIPIDIALI